jgi:hypothetical protein
LGKHKLQSLEQYCLHPQPLLTPQDFTALSTKIFRQCVIIILSVNYLLTSSPTKYSVGFPFVSNSTFRRYIGRKYKKIICRWFYRRNLRVKKKVSNLKYTDGFYSVGDLVIYRRLRTVGKFVGECLKYRPNISVCKFVGNYGSYCQMPTDSFCRWSCRWVYQIPTEYIRL